MKKRLFGVLAVTLFFVGGATTVYAAQGNLDF